MAATDFQRGDTHQGFFPDMNPKASFLSGLKNSSFEDAQRLGRYSAFYDFYNGKQWKKARPDKERQVTANFARLFVNKGASFLMAKGWTVKDKDDVGSREQLEFINAVWEINNKELISIECAQVGGIFGDAFLTILPNSQKGISINVVPPMFCTPIFHPTNKTLLVGAIIEYPLNVDVTSNPATGGTRGPGLLTMLIDSMTVSQYIDGKEVYKQVHGLGEVPLVFIKNRIEATSTYGTSDIAAVCDMNRLYNEKLQDISDIINYHAAPVTLAYGIRMKNMIKGARKMWSGLPNPKDAKIENLELKSDLGASNTNLETIRKLMFMLAEMPEAAFGDINAISNTTGLAIQLMYGPMLDSLGFKRISYGSGFSAANRIITKYGIKLGYLTAPKLYTWLDMAKYYATSIDWADPLPIDELLRLNMVISRLQNGLMTMDDALSTLGVPNVRRYAELIRQDMMTGRNFFLSKNLQSALSNIGGIMRNNSTSSNNNGSINGSSRIWTPQNPVAA